MDLANARHALWLWWWLLRWLVALALLLAAVLALCWQKRVQLVPVLAKRFGKVDVSLAGLHVSWVLAANPLRRLAALDAPFESLTITVRAPVLFTPFTPKEGTPAAQPKGTPESAPASAASMQLAPAAGTPGAPAPAPQEKPAKSPGAPATTAPEPAADPTRDEFLRCKLVVVRLLHTGALRSFDAHAEVDGAALRFVSYDRQFKDTNTQRLAVQTARHPLPPQADAPAIEAKAKEEEAAAQAAPGPVSLRTVHLTNASIAVQLNLTDSPSTAKGVLPPLLLQDETVELAKLRGPPGFALLAWMNGLVFRALALSSVAAVRAIFDLPSDAANNVVGHSLDLLDQGLDKVGAFLPGSKELGTGLTGGLRSAWAGVHGATEGALDAAASTTSGAAVGASNADPLEFLRSVRTGTESLGSVAGDVGVASVDHAVGAGDAVLSSVDKFAERLAPAKGAIHGITGVARGALSGAGQGASAGVHGATSAAGQLGGGALGGVGGIGKALRQGDARELKGAGEQLVGGLTGGTRALAEGVVGVAGGAGEGAVKGSKALSDGLGETARGVGKGLKEGLAGIFGRKKADRPAEQANAKHE